MKYMKKPGVVEAFEVTPDRIKNADEWPEWLWVSLKGETARPNFRISDSGEQVMVLTKKGAKQIYVGDWMIKTSEGDIYSCDSFDFAYEYMMVVEEQEEASVSWVDAPEIQQKTAEYYLMVIGNTILKRDDALTKEERQSIIQGSMSVLLDSDDRLGNFGLLLSRFEETCVALEREIDSLKSERVGLAHEIWASAQLMPGEGIADGVSRIISILSRYKEEV